MCCCCYYETAVTFQWKTQFCKSQTRCIEWKHCLYKVFQSLFRNILYATMCLTKWLTTPVRACERNSPLSKPLKYFIINNSAISCCRRSRYPVKLSQCFRCINSTTFSDLVCCHQIQTHIFWTPQFIFLLNTRFVFFFRFCAQSCSKAQTCKADILLTGGERFIFLSWLKEIVRGYNWIFLIIRWKWIMHSFWMNCPRRGPVKLINKSLGIFFLSLMLGKIYY